MPFETPELTVIRFDLKDVLTASQWDLPVVSEETEPKPTGWETPIYP